MSYLIPAWQIKGDSYIYRANAMEAGIQKVLATGVVRSRGDIEITDLIPSNLGLTSWEINNTGVWVDHVVEHVTAIYKIIQLSKWSNIDCIIINGYPYSLVSLYTYGQEGYLSEPHIVDMGKGVRISLEGIMRGEEEKIALVGFVFKGIKSNE